MNKITSDYNKRGATTGIPHMKEKYLEAGKSQYDSFIAYVKQQHLHRKGSVSRSHSLPLRMLSFHLRHSLNLSHFTPLSLSFSSVPLTPFLSSSLLFMLCGAASWAWWWRETGSHWRTQRSHDVEPDSGASWDV